MRDDAIVTIGLPFTEQLPQLKLAVASIRSQTCQKFRVVAVADGAAHESVAWLNSLEDERFVVRFDGSSRGLAYRLNEITRASATEYLIRMDADDVMFPDRIERQLSYMKSHPAIDVLCGNAIAIDGEDGILGVINGTQLPSTAASFLNNNPIVHPTVCMTTTWAMMNPYDEAYRRCQDKELWLRAYASNAFALMASPILFYRLYPTLRLDAYRATSRFNRMLFTHQRSVPLSEMERRRAIVASYTKEGVYIIAARMRAAKYLQSQRYDPLDEAQAEVFRGVYLQAVDRPL